MTPSLIIDTTLPRSTSIGCVIKEDFLFYQFFHTEKQQSEKVFHLLNSLKQLVSLKDIKSIYLNIGPGSFTSIRIGTVIARTIAHINNIKIFPFNTFDLFKQFSMDLKMEGKVVIPILDAKRNEYFWKPIKNGSFLKEEIQVSDLQKIINQFKGERIVLVVVGDLKIEVGGRRGEIEIIENGDLLISAYTYKNLIESLQNNGKEYFEVEPLYIRSGVKE